MKKENELKIKMKNLGLTISEFHNYAHTNQGNMSYYKRHNKTRYNDTITAGIVNYFDISHDELIQILKLYNLQRKKQN